MVDQGNELFRRNPTVGNGVLGKLVSKACKEMVKVMREHFARGPYTQVALYIVVSVCVFLKFTNNKNNTCKFLSIK